MKLIKPAPNTRLVKVAAQYSATNLGLIKAWFSSLKFVLKIPAFAKLKIIGVRLKDNKTVNSMQPK